MSIVPTSQEIVLSSFSEMTTDGGIRRQKNSPKYGKRLRV